ncbi:hypothetical protein [Priestia endophytica]|uniref:Uncharacterized protein n=1 Tax=Priestia endophytica DSM 13796 TaxID=1121089 RepID=A0A1I6C0E9_9BACI|nr:hypothetical protein [Priestia endophytica]KYG33435.1 hypothetical protein AZF06_21560 [Priestia endophytica]SFQ86653.1 hypothetical protein SAMN02745910_04690 [Priestia endophytica DSM 13796]
MQVRKQIEKSLPNYESTYYYFCTGCGHKETYLNPVVKLSCGCGTFMDHIEIEGKEKPIFPTLKQPKESAKKRKKRKKKYEQLTLI